MQLKFECWWLVEHIIEGLVVWSSPTWVVRGLVRLNSDNRNDCLILQILSILPMSHLSSAIGSIWNTPTRKNIQICFFHDWARKLQHHDMRGEECCWCVLLLDIPSNSFLKTWQSAKKSILCETRKSIFAGRRWSDSVFLPGRLSAQPWSQEQGTPTPFFPNSSFSLTPRTSQFSAFLLTSRHFTEHTFCSNFSTGPGYLKQFRHLSFIIRKTGKNLPPPSPEKNIFWVSRWIRPF